VLTIFATLLKRKHVFGAQIGYFFTIWALKEAWVSKVRCFAYIWGKGLTKNDETPWNNPNSRFSMLTFGLTPNFGEKLLFCNIFIFFS
jgi:hypothetical protein